jgi:hypothetical protein
VFDSNWKLSLGFLCFAKVDLFIIDDIDLGTLYALKLRHDMTGQYTDWYLDFVQINDGSYNYTFDCNKWLSPHKDDQAVERVFIESNALLQFEFDNFII